MPRVVPTQTVAEVITIEDQNESQVPVQIFQHVAHPGQLTASATVVNESSEKVVIAIVAFLVIFLLGAVLTVILSKK